MQEDTKRPAVIPGESAVTPAAPAGVQALCCGCGHLNTFTSCRKSASAGLHNPGERAVAFIWSGESPMPPGDDDEAWARAVMQRKCSNCQQVTAQAILRNGAYRDFLEDVHRWRCLEGRRKSPIKPGWTLPYCSYCQAGAAEELAELSWDARHGRTA